jgi:signal transduction histidine kinase
MTQSVLSMERSIARCRIVLSLSALVAIYVDPTEPSGGLFAISSYTLLALGGHLVYSLAVSRRLARAAVDPTRLATATVWGDVAFAMAIAMVTEGTSSPFHVFFAFPLLAVGFRSGLRSTLVVVGVSVALYLSLTLLRQHPEDLNLRIMRPAYLAILGYLVGYMGERRLELEATVRQLESRAQRAAIARSLHDGFCQALAGVNLRLQACQALLRKGRSDEALGQLADLQTGVTREYDELRSYVRALAERSGPEGNGGLGAPTRFSVRLECEGSAHFVDHVLQIVREAVTNVQRHAHARTASVVGRPVGDRLVVSIDDDGRGFARGAEAPWSIASRTEELGGTLHVAADGRPGAHLEVSLPRA